VNYKTILVNEEDGIRTITLNRPERRNALTPQMQDELTAALESSVSANHARVVLLAGADDVFCAGLDLEHLQIMASQPQSAHEADARRMARLFRTLYELPKPTIAIVRGAAVAGGMGLAMLCDLTFASPAAKFGFTEVKIGFVPALVSAFLTLQIGDKLARDLLLTGRLLLAEEAAKLGLINAVVPTHELVAHAHFVGHSLKANSPQSIRATKQLMAAQNKAWLDAAITRALSANAEARSTHDFKEGITAFLEKRKPLWESR